MSTSTNTSRAVQFVESFGGPETLELRQVPVPEVGAGQVRVRVTAAGLNPMDWFMTSDSTAAARFGLSLPCGFGNDYAGVVEEVGEGAEHLFTVGDRVFGGAFSRSVADHVVVNAPGHIGKGGDVHHTPEGLDDDVAAVLSIAGCTAAAALAVVDPGPADTLLIGGAGGGVGVFAVQLARLAGARVIGTGSAGSAEDLLALGAEPVAYGAGLADRVRALAPDGVTAAMDLHGTDTIAVARELGVPEDRMTTIAAVVDGVKPANGANAAPGAIDEIARSVAEGRIHVPIAARFPVEEIRRDAGCAPRARQDRGRSELSAGPAPRGGPRSERREALRFPRAGDDPRPPVLAAHIHAADGRADAIDHVGVSVRRLLDVAGDMGGVGAARGGHRAAVRLVCRCVATGLQPPQRRRVLIGGAGAVVRAQDVEKDLRAGGLACGVPAEAFGDLCRTACVPGQCVHLVGLEGALLPVEHHDILLSVTVAVSRGEPAGDLGP